MTDTTTPGTGGITRFAPDSDLTIYHATAQKDALIAALDNAQRLELDLTAVSEIDTAGLQLLILIKREARARNKELVISGHTNAVRQVIDFCNLAASFGDPMVIPA